MAGHAPGSRSASGATTVSVAAKVPGRLAAVTVKEGDQVAAGDAVARLTLPEIEAKVAQAKALHEAAAAKADMAQEGARTEELDAARADLARARAGEHLARVTNTRVAALFKDGLVSTQKRDEAAAQLKASSELAAAAAAKVTALENGARRQEKTAAEALAAQAAGGVAEASSLAGEAEVRTPASGEVTRVVMHAGEVVPAGFPVVLVTDLADSWAVFNIREDELKKYPSRHHSEGQYTGARRRHGFFGLLDQSARHLCHLACNASVFGLRPAHL